MKYQKADTTQEIQEINRIITELDEITKWLFVIQEKHYHTIFELTRRKIDMIGQHTATLHEELQGKRP